MDVLSFTTIGSKSTAGGRLRMPYYCAIHLDALYVTDYDKGCVCVYDLTTSKHLHTIGRRSKTLKIKHPTGIVVNYPEVYVADSWSHSIYSINVVDMSHKVISSQTTDSTDPYYLDYPSGMAIWNGRLYIADRKGGKIVMLSTAGEKSGIITRGLNEPTGLAVDSTTGVLYVSDQRSKYIKIFEADGTYKGNLSSSSRNDLGYPYGVSFTRLDGIPTLIITECSSHRVRVCSLGSDDGVEFEDFLGGEGDGDMCFVYPRGVACGEDGKVYIADSENTRVCILNIQAYLRIMRIAKMKRLSLGRLAPPSPSLMISSPRVSTDRLLTNIRRLGDLSNLLEMANFVCDVGSVNSVNTIRMEAFFPPIEDISAEYIYRSSEKKIRDIISSIGRWNWKSFGKDDVRHLIKFINAIQYASDLGWLVSILNEKIYGVISAEQHLLEIDEVSAIGYNSSTKALYRKGRYHDTDVFVKTVSTENEMYWDREIDIGLKMHHPHIVSLLDYELVYDSQNILWNVNMIFEYGSADLNEVVCGWYRAKTHSNSIPPFSHRLEIAKDIVKGLRYIHSLGIVHRDVKSANILVCPTKICDFGLAEYERKLSTISECEGPAEDLAPEVSCKSKGEVTYSVDVYNLGGVFIQLFEIVPSKQLRGYTLSPSNISNLIHNMRLSDPSQRIGLGEVERVLSTL